MNRDAIPHCDDASTAVGGNKFKKQGDGNRPRLTFFRRTFRVSLNISFSTLANMLVQIFRFERARGGPLVFCIGRPTGFLLVGLFEI